LTLRPPTQRIACNGTESFTRAGDGRLAQAHPYWSDSTESPKHPTDGSILPDESLEIVDVRLPALRVGTQRVGEDGCGDAQVLLP
jgi:hypothetical protein